MKKTIYVLILLLIVVSSLVFGFAPFAYGSDTTHEIKNETTKPICVAERKANVEEQRKKWEASPDGIMFKEWKESPSGKKVYTAEAKIRKSIRDFSNMEAVITSLSLPSGSRLGYGVMVRINDEDYILALGTEKAGESFSKNLKVNDKLLIRSHSVSHAPKYTYPIISGDYVERSSKVIYKRNFSKNNGC